MLRSKHQRLPLSKSLRRVDPHVDESDEESDNETFCRELSQARAASERPFKSTACLPMPTPRAQIPSVTSNKSRRRASTSFVSGSGTAEAGFSQDAFAYNPFTASSAADAFCTSRGVKDASKRRGTPSFSNDNGANFVADPFAPDPFVNKASRTTAEPSSSRQRKPSSRRNSLASPRAQRRSRKKGSGQDPFGSDPFESGDPFAESKPESKPRVNSSKASKERRTSRRKSTGVSLNRVPEDYLFSKNSNHTTKTTPNSAHRQEIAIPSMLNKRGDEGTNGGIKLSSKELLLRSIPAPGEVALDASFANSSLAHSSFANSSACFSEDESATEFSEEDWGEPVVVGKAVRRDSATGRGTHSLRKGGASRKLHRSQKSTKPRSDRKTLDSLSSESKTSSRVEEETATAATPSTKWSTDSEFSPPAGRSKSLKASEPLGLQTGSLLNELALIMDGGGGADPRGAPRKMARHWPAGDTDDPFVVQNCTRGADMKTFQRQKSSSGPKSNRPRAPARSKSHNK